MSSSTPGSEARRLLAALACFLAALLVLDRAASVTIGAFESRYYASGNDFERQLGAYVRSRSLNALILGVSRTREAIFPTRLEAGSTLRFFKEAYQGKGPRYQLRFYRLFKRHAGAPKLVIYGLDYFVYSIESDRRWLSRFSSTGTLEGPRMMAAPLLLRLQKHQNELFFNHLIGDLSDRLTWALLPGGDAFEQSRTYAGTPGQPPRQSLFEGEPRSYRKLPMPRPPGIEGQDLERLLVETEADGVPVVLVSLPDYVATYRSNFEMDLFHDELRRLSRRHRNVRVLIYNDPARFDLADASLFFDGGWGLTNSHLSAAGGARLSQLLARDLAPLLRP